MTKDSHILFEWNANKYFEWYGSKYEKLSDSYEQKFTIFDNK